MDKLHFLIYYSYPMEKTTQLVLTLPKSIRILLYSALAFGSFAIPFTISQHQLVTGTLVNAVIIGSVLLFPNRLILPIIIFPSLGVLSRGIIFGPLTPFLTYFLPIIWAGNLVLVFLFKNMQQKFGFWSSLGISAVAKYLLLYSFTNIFFHLQLVPKLFVQTMGTLQLITAIAGGTIAYFVLKGFRGK